MDEGSLLSKVQGSMVGHTIGDRLGWPYESMKPEEIELVRDDNGRLKFFRPLYHYFDSMIRLSAGDATDDTQHANALARSLIWKKGFDQYDFAGELIDEYRRCRAGWGSGSKKATEEFIEFYQSFGRKGRNPVLPASHEERKGGGNGIAMKAHVIGLWHSVVSPEQLTLEPRDVFLVGIMTHTHPGAIVVSATFATAVDHVIRKTIHIGENDLLELLRTVAQTHEQIWDERYAEQFHLPRVRRQVSDKLELLLNNQEWLDDPVALRASIGTACFALESVIFAIASFIRHPIDFEAGMEEVIAAGGDTDTNAAMYGALAGTNGGLEVIPQEWREYNKEIIGTAELARQLYRTAKSLR